MDWLFPSTVATLVGTVLLTATFGFLYRSNREPFLAIWTYAWCLYAVRFVFMLLYIRSGSQNDVFLMASQCFSLWSGVLLLWGGYRFIGRRLPGGWIYLGILMSLFILAAGGRYLSLRYLSLPVFIFLGWVYIWTGILFLRQDHQGGDMARIVGILFIVWGIHKADYPFLRPLAWFAPWGYLLGATLEVLIAVGILMVYFQKIHHKILETGEQYRLILENQNDLVVKFDSRHRILYASPSYCSTFGKTEKELIGHDFKPLIMEEDRPRVEASLSGLNNAPHTAYHEERAQTVNGLRWLAWSLKAVIAADGRISKVVAVGRDITGQKHAEQALVASEQKLRHILVNTPQIGIALNASVKIIFANQYFLELTGWARDEVLGQDWIDMFIPEDQRVEMRKVFDTAVTSRDTRGFSTNENEIVTKSGERRNVAWSNLLSTDSRGEVIDITSFGVDLTERKRSEAALRQSEAYMRSVFRCAPTGIGVVVNRVFKQVNQTFCEMTGFAEAELIGQRSRMIYATEEDYEAVGCEKYKQINRYGTGTVETRFKRKDGRIIDVLLSSTPIDVRNLESGVTFTALDISKMRQAEAALKKSETRYRTMMEAIQDPVYIGSQDYRIEYVNPAMIALLGRDATGDFCYRALHGLDSHCPWCQHRRIVAEGHAEKEVVSPRDNRSYSVSSSVFANADGSFSKISVMRDNTDFKRLQNQLQQAQKMEAIGNLAGGIAHDFNNILFPIIGLSEMLLEDLTPGSESFESVQEILAAGKRGGDLVKQILAFSRQSDHQLIPVRIQPVLKEVLKLSRSTIPADIDIEHDIQSSCGRVMANPTQLHQIAMNLITNAYHAVEATSGKIWIGLSEVVIQADANVGNLLTPGSYALLSVADTGSGIDPSIMDKIFEPYFTTKQQGKGTGLGLSVVYGIVREYRGDIRVASAPGEGTRFDIYLPLKDNRDDLPLAQQTAMDNGGREHILLVDDESSVVRLVKQMLERLGYRVTSRTSSVEALEAFQSCPNAFDLVLTDMTMPNMTGDQLIKAMTRIRPDLPVIICTGFSDRINQERAAAIGINGFLMKPVVKSEMARMVRRVLDASPAVAGGPE